MVRIAAPPPLRPPAPLFYTVSAGTHLVRIFNPTTPRQVGPLTFNHNGPRSRFDHHRCPTENSPGPYCDDPERGVYYAGWTLSCCIAECFGDYRMIDNPLVQVANPRVVRPLNLLDLCGNGGMRAGAVGALASIADRSVSQAWARYFYEEAVFQRCDGIRYHNAHNAEPAVVLFERAKDALHCPPEQVIPLADPLLRTDLQFIALQQDMILTF